MIKVTSSLKMNLPRLKALDKAAQIALEQTGEYLHTEIVQAQVVPRMDGTLSGEAFWVDTSKSKRGKVELVHSTPYARRLYFHPEYNFHHSPWSDYRGTHSGNPNAKGLWFEDWQNGGAHEAAAAAAFTELYRRAAGL